MTDPYPPNTVLSLVFTGESANGLNPYSVRQAHQTLEPIDAVKGANGSGGVFRRTVNGTLIDLSAHQMRKYKSEITCTDQGAPALDGRWTGLTVLVSCNRELSYPTGGTADRPPVDGSVRVEGDFTYYRPLLTMMVTDFTVDFDEWGAETGWKLSLEEV